MSDYFVLAVGLVVFSAFGGFFTLAFLSNNRAAGSHQEVLQALHGIHSNHIHLAMQQSDTSQALLNMGAHFNKINATFRRNEKESKRKPVRQISRNTSRQLRRSEDRCAQLFADQAIAIAEKTRTERNFIAAQDHIRQLLGQRNRNEDVARLNDIVTALGARIAQLEHQEQSRLTSPPTPPPTTPTPTNTIDTTLNTNGLSPVTFLNAIEPVEPTSVSDARSIAKIDSLESKLAEVTKDKEELENAAKASEAQVARLQDQADAMQERQHEQLASINEHYGIVKYEYAKLTNSLPSIQKDAAEGREEILQAQFDEEKHKLERDYQESYRLLQVELDAAEQKSTESLLEQRKLETSQDELVRKLEGEKSVVEAKCRKELEELQRKLDASEGKLAEVLSRNSNLEDDQQRRQRQYEEEKAKMSSHHKEERDRLQHKLDTSEKRLVEVSSEQRKLETDLKQTKDTLQATRDDPLSLLSDDQRQQLAYYPSLVLVLYGDGTALNPGVQAQLHATTMALDDARIDEAALQVEVSELTDTNVALKLELEDLRESNIITLAQVNQPSAQICIAESSESINKDVTAPAKLLGDNDTIVTCVGYVLGDGEKLIKKTCHTCEQLVALPHWQRGDAVWVAKWGVHMKTCSHKQESEKKGSPIKRPDEKTTPVAKVNDDPKKDDLQEKTVLPNIATPKLRHVWVRPPTYASQPTPDSVQGLKQCKKCGYWYEFDTNFEKETFRIHVSLCEEVVCKHEGCGDVMSKDHFFREHQQVCKKRAAGERKKLSFTEAAKSAPKRQDTFDILTADGTARKSAERASAEPIDDGVTVDDYQHGTEEELPPEEGRKRGGLQGGSIWVAS